MPQINTVRVQAFDMKMNTDVMMIKNIICRNLSKIAATCTNGV